MPRLRSIHTGAVVSVTDEKAARLGEEWQPIKESSAPAKKPAAKKAPPKSDK